MLFPLVERGKIWDSELRNFLSIQGYKLLVPENPINPTKIQYLQIIRLKYGQIWRICSIWRRFKQNTSWATLFAAVVGVESDFQSFSGIEKNTNYSDLKSLHLIQNFKKFSTRRSSSVYNSVVEFTKTRKPFLFW